MDTPKRTRKAAEARIGVLPQLIASLPRHERTLAQRLFQVVAETGTIVPPREMIPWLGRTFGSVEATLHQHIVRVTNRWTFEGATFNPLRGRRPGNSLSAPGTAMPAELRALVESTRGDDFCDPEHHTPADVFGRVRGRHVLTSSNVAKADGWHSVTIFDRHDPLAIDEELVADMLGVAGEWASRAHAEDSEARHFFLLWNCLPRAGASLIHGHTQMTLSREMPHARVALWHEAAARYRRETEGDYFADLVRVCRALSLVSGEEEAVTTFASLTPVKEREVDIVTPVPSGQTTVEALRLLAVPLWQLLNVALHEWGVHAFNVAVFGPPFDAQPGREDFPLVVRFVDRGNPLAPAADIAALELFGSSVVAGDPFDVARSLRAHRT
ncbi:MAG TPA: hypothetical protein VGP82_14595 [Ktedonobacterales bacterium]|nr:hypothetical protein [Ktedonobacterales bacterium]